MSNSGRYLYAFPENGITLWRLEYMKDTPARAAFYDPPPGDRHGGDLGRRFMEVLVAKYKEGL